MLRSIMVELSNSADATPAMETALSLARSFDARLHALSCLDERTVRSSEIRQTLEERVRGWQDAFVKECEEVGVVCITDLEVGDRQTALVHLSRKADLLVVGDRLHSDTHELGFSASALAIARAAVRDVLFVRATPPTFDSVVVAYAGRENSCNALRLAACLAEKVEGTLHVVTSEYDVKDATALLRTAHDYLNAYNVSVTRHQMPDEPVQGVLETARKVGADLIALGAYRHTKLHALAFGDTAEAILHASPVSMLICR